VEKQPHANYCGARTRSGLPCRNRAMANGRCRMHGGKSTGPPKGNKNAVKTGEHETIWMDALDPEERVLFHVVDTDVLKQIDEELRLITIRERRMLQRIERLRAAGDFTIVRQTVGIEKGKKTNLQEAEGTLGQIQAIEEALTRVQEKKAKLLELKHKIETANGKTEEPADDGFLEALEAKAAEVWDDDETND
jgi:Uncharacterized conserved protein